MTSQSKRSKQTPKHENQEKPHHILMIVENLPLPFDRRVWMEATTLRRAGYEVSIICPTGKGYDAEHEVIDGINIHRHPLPPEGERALGYFREYAHALRWEFRLARRIWKEHPFDLVHICNPPDLLYLVAGWFKRFHGVRVLFDQHDLNPELFEAKYRKRGPFHRALLLAERATFRTADVVVSTNESYREVALTRGKKSPEDVFIVRSGPRLEDFSPVAPDPQWRNGRAHLVGYVGVMGEQEGLDHVLDAAQHLRTTGRDDIHWMLVGGGPALERLRQRARDMGIDDIVEFPGRVPDKQLIERLSTTDVCVSPDTSSPFNDKSTMNKVLEYMALGKPVVQFDLTEGRRSAGDASLYAADDDPKNLANLIAELLDDPERARNMGALGRRRMETELEWRFQEPILLAAYDRAFQKRQP